MQLTYYNIWNSESYRLFLNELSELGNKDYLEFNKKIVFTKYKMIGIRVPDIRTIAKEISKGDIFSFLDCEFVGYFEELLLRGALLSYIKDFDMFVFYLGSFVDLVDNWAVCDMALSSFKIISKNRDIFINKVKEYINSNDEFIVRVGIIALLDYYLVDDYIDEVFDLINSIYYRAYYVDMAIAWLISVAFVKYRDKTLAFLDSNKLDKVIIRMAVQKIRDSKRVEKYFKDFILKYK